ncbi:MULTISPECIES: lysis protein [unclassified Pseudomonas]|uniref:lysis protein n=1 Tax=unclassified Pseudomonas TaxID=196821 RepID=UPI00244C789D|nr:MULTISPECIES: lysis protein [unclassified Pseudomonas]MDH0894373.1 lysis protein [Pseudomonas sp. GD03875]MDH1063332.1 lysis protein [Pseudomonas sp. GD03985]
MAVDLRRYLFLLVVLAWVVSVLFALSAGNRAGERTAREAGEKALGKLREQHSEQRAQVAEQNLLTFQQQVARANAAEELWLRSQQELADLQLQLQERIPHVTTVYRPAPAAEPVPIPRCVFTAGWVRDFNLALTRAGMPAAAGGAGAPLAAAATEPAPGSAAELLESGVTPADILAYAQDYGRWARDNLARFHALQSLHKD